MALALLSEIVALQDAEDAAAGEAACFSPLLALHALALADPSLCCPPRDPAKFARSLAPYLIPPDQVRGTLSGLMLTLQALLLYSVRRTDAIAAIFPLPVLRPPLGSPAKLS